MANAPAEAKYIVQQSDVSLPNAQDLASLSNGILKNNSGGIVSIASPTADYIPYNPELESIAALNPSSGDILVAINSGTWGHLSLGDVGTVLMSTSEGLSYEPVIPQNTSLITATPSTAGAPASRLLVGADGIAIVDVPAGNAIFLTVDGILDSLYNVGSSGLLVNNSGNVLTRSIVSSNSSVSIANSQGLAGDININVNNDTSYQQVRVLSNSTLVGTRSQLNFIPGQNTGLTIQDDGINNRVDITISAIDPVIPAGVTWTVVTSSGGMSPNMGYLINGSSLVSLSLPTTAAVGEVIRVAGFGNSNWSITQGPSQKIIFGSTYAGGTFNNSATTVGMDGSLASTAHTDAVELVCVVQNTTFLAVSMCGNVTVN